MVFLLLSHSVCVCVRVWCVCEKGRRERESAHNRLTFFGHITNLFIYFTIPLRWASVFPEECAHSKAILIRTSSRLQLPTSVLGIFAHFGLHSVPHICSVLPSWEQVSSFTYIYFHPQLIFLPPNVQIWKCIINTVSLHKIFKRDGNVLHKRLPSKVLFVLSLLARLPRLSHICPVRERLQKPTDVLVFRPGSTDGELLITLNDSPGNTPTHILTCRQNHYRAFLL